MELILSWSYSLLGSGYYLLGDLTIARSNIEKGIDISIKTGVETTLAPQYRLLSSVFHDSGDLKNAKSYAEEALEVAEKFGQRHFQGYASISLGRMKGKTDVSNFDEAEECILRGINILDELNLRTWCAHGYLFLGEVYAEKGERGKALENWKRAKGMYQEMEMRYSVARVYVGYAWLFEREGELSKAREALIKAIEIFQEFGADGSVKRTEEKLAQL
jgi:tetratricopeptide (TPR) repeat protein